ncbi:unnamed protein product [Polarella glacialis]|uniref:Uncharacterized protein n=1 Tax=Polarella glacialis TaxID=89957 RepID=A0A813GH45_POLGL|nr:unnamed protein product [Polarella glacialis]
MTLRTDSADAGLAWNDDESLLEATLAATLQVVDAQRRQLDALRGELAESREDASGLQLELEREREGRSAAEARMRESAVEFARRLFAMQARVVEAERDVLLGCQVLVTRSAPSSSAGRGRSNPHSAASPGGSDAESSPPGKASGLVPVPPPPRSSDEAMFPRPQCQILRPPAGPGLGASPGARRAVSAQHRLDPLLTPRAGSTALC